jgi:hypothetical protein
MSFYVGNMLGDGDCFVLDWSGIPCGQATVAWDPVPLCHKHLADLYWRAHMRLHALPPLDLPASHRGTDPDCLAGKHRSCLGAPCVCECHR